MCTRLSHEIKLEIGSSEANKLFC